MKVATVVVTYNRKELLAENIKMQYAQTILPDTIIIIDNHGTDGTQNFLESKGLLSERIQYIYLDNNIGGAGGFETGTRIAYEQGFDFIILMDDDGRPDNEYTFEKLIQYANERYPENQKLMLNSLVLFDEKTLSFTLRGTKDRKNVLALAKGGFIFGSISPFNGTLISKKLIKSMGFPRGDFFIKGDESEYTMRANANGALIGTVVESIYHHPLLASDSMRILWKTQTVSYLESPWKEYYRSRNYTYMYCSKNDKLKAWFLYRIRLHYAKKKKADKTVIDNIKLGYLDGKAGNMGKTITP